MAESNITKWALAASLKELMMEQPFEKINVAQICERCNMNRKSFYYHFKDKYDLVNWIFDTEFIALVKEEDLGSRYQERWAFIEKTCHYFYQNHVFYRKALQIRGQNSFYEHFREYIRPLLADRITYVFKQAQPDAFTLDFFTDALLCAMERWLLTKECMPPEEFLEKIKRLTEEGARSICRELSQAEQEENGR
ncbi:dihydroxyacetone kinase transcriptional activator DhaS [Flavonifractor sp. An92]|uniref:TetR/AcrR family transcriptional regulator C-terminal domain-containing protein n=1 Tax=Flavonifractor sp. An92 TaxID=1965666 RepID=UPI000B3716D7|nr:TetR/AcrR family transcriptional regulator C-terminal domain-containing protein [Flavonifractor sp. An92]OUN08641.1 dihydroxyacetone kinase transcriptional activator DhaS [Flavonifractor sp. An92]